MTPGELLSAIKRRWLPLQGAACLLLCIWCLGACGDSLEIHDDIVIEPVASVSRACKPNPNPTIVYLNFKGQKIIKSYYSNAKTNRSSIGGGTIPPCAMGQQTTLKTVNVVKYLFAPFNIRVVTSRPSTGDYHMAVIGGTESDINLKGFSSGIVGVAPLDCGNNNPRDIVFVFSSKVVKKYPASAQVYQTAVVIAHELGHAFGLPHMTDLCDIMYPSGGGACATGMKAFLNKAMSITPGYSCGPKTVNPYQHILKLIGANTKDTSPPLVRITSPVNKSTVDTSSKVDAEISDDKKVVKVTLLVDGKIKSVHKSNLASFSVKLAAGQHVLRVEARDAAGNVGFDQVQVQAVAVKPPDATPPVDDLGLSDQQPSPDGGSAVTVRGGCSMATGGQVQHMMLPLALMLLLWWCRRAIRR